MKWTSILTFFMATHTFQPFADYLKCSLSAHEEVSLNCGHFTKLLKCFVQAVMLIESILFQQIVKGLYV
jgi:hypothetical protein